jgi:hypothetical protein
VRAAGQGDGTVGLHVLLEARVDRVAQVVALCRSERADGGREARGDVELDMLGSSRSGAGAAPIFTSSCWGTDAHGLSSGAVHAASATRPPGRSTRRVSRSAVAGSASSMYAQRAMTASMLAAGRSSHSASIVRNSALSIRSSAARARARSTIASTASVLSSLPPGAMSSAASSPVSPGPAPISST